MLLIFFVVMRQCVGGCGALSGCVSAYCVLMSCVMHILFRSCSLADARTQDACRIALPGFVCAVSDVVGLAVVVTSSLVIANALVCSVVQCMVIA